MNALTAALALVVSFAGLAAGETYVLTPTDGSAPGYKVTADHEPVMTPQGVAALPPGTKLAVEADGSSKFDVFVVGPTALDSATSRHKWEGTVDRPGGYVVQYGRERGQYLSQLQFVVTPDPQSFARVTGYDYGWQER